MSGAAELIAAGYVQLKDREKLRDLLTHRQSLLDVIGCVSGIDPKLTVEEIRKEIAVIESAFRQLDGRRCSGHRRAARVRRSSGPDRVYRTSESRCRIIDRISCRPGLQSRRGDGPDRVDGSASEC